VLTITITMTPALGTFIFGRRKGVCDFLAGPQPRQRPHTKTADMYGRSASRLRVDAPFVDDIVDDIESQESHHSGRSSSVLLQRSIPLSEPVRVRARQWLRLASSFIKDECQVRRGHLCLCGQIRPHSITAHWWTCLSTPTAHSCAPVCSVHAPTVPVRHCSKASGPRAWKATDNQASTGQTDVAVLASGRLCESKLAERENRGSFALGASGPSHQMYPATSFTQPG
jgi:hypothetical protein